MTLEIGAYSVELISIPGNRKNFEIFLIEELF